MRAQRSESAWKYGAALALTLALFAGGCSDDDGASGTPKLDENEQEYADALAENLAYEADDAAQFLTTEEAECAAPRWIEIMGAERLREKGVEPADLKLEEDATITAGVTRDEAGKMVDVLGDCDVDLRERMFSSMDLDDMSDEDRACTEELMTDEVLREMFIVMLSDGLEGAGDNEILMEVREKSMECSASEG